MPLIIAIAMVVLLFAVRWWILTFGTVKVPPIRRGKGSKKYKR